MFRPSWVNLHQLYSEQTTPFEIIAFVLVTTATCMILAAVLYAVVMTVFWAVRLRRDNVKFLDSFLPTPQQFRDYAGEYFLALATTIVLTFTLTVKHDTVEFIKTTLSDAKLSSPEDCAKLNAAQVFPLQVCPSQLGGISVLNLLRLAEEDGQSESIKRVVESMYNSQASSLPWQGITENKILATAAIVMLIYLLWLARGRMRYLLTDPNRESDFDYSTTARGLLYLSVCIALLLLAPTIIPSAETIGQSTLGSLKADNLASEEIPDAEKQVQATFRKQHEKLSVLDATSNVPSNHPDPAVLTMIAALGGRLDAIESARLDDARAIDGIRTQMRDLEDVHRQDITRIDRRLQALEEARKSDIGMGRELKQLRDQFTKSERELLARTGTLEKRLAQCCK